VLKKLFAFTLLALTSVVIVYYLQTNREKGVNENSKETPQVNLTLNREKPQLLEISETEALEIEKVIAYFEEYKYKKDFVGAIGMLTPPKDQEEGGWLDHLLGTDLVKLNNDKPSPRFTNKVNYHLLVGYDIWKITKKEGVFYTYVKELRVLNVAEEGTIPKYETKMQDLTFELLNNERHYKISKYYHANPSSSVNLKYEGFAAF